MFHPRAVMSMQLSDLGSSDVLFGRMSGVRESGPETPGTEQRKRKGSPGESLDPRSQWIAEKRRREQEQRYVEELAELVSANLAEFVGNVKPDTCAVLRETVLQIRQLKRQEQEQCASSRGEVQQPDISSSGQSVIEKDSLGPLLLKALDAFFFVVNAEGYLAFVSENVRCYLGFGQEELLNSYVYNLLHIGDHEEFSRHLPKPPANSTPWHSDGTRHSSHTFHCRMLVHRSNNEAATPAAEDQYETMQCFAVVQPPAADESDGDLQPCLICVARRAQRHEMPTVETFSTRQDKTGKIIAIDTSSLQASMRPGWQILVRKCIHAFFQNVENGLPLSHRHHRDVLMKGFAQSAPYRFALPDGSMAVGQSKSRMQALPNQTHIVSSIHTVFRYCKHSGEGLVRPSPVIPDQISATNDPNGGTPSASLNCPQTPMGIVSGRSDVSMGRLPPGAPPPGRYVGMPGAMALGSPSRNSPCGAVGSGPMPCQGSYMRTPRTPPVAKPVGSPGMPFSPQRPSGPYLTNAGFACPGASPGEGITPGSGTPPGQTPSPSPRLVSPSPSVTSPCQVVTPSVGQRIPYVPRSYSTGHYGKQEDWSAEGKEQIATATPGSTQQNIECSQADGTTQECEEPAKSPTKLLQLLTVGPEVGGRLSLDSVRSSEPPGSGPATSNSGSNPDGSAGGSGITGGGAAGCAGGGGVSPSLHSTSLTERHKILHKLLQDGSSSPDINKLTASQQPLSVGSGQVSIKAEELSTVKQEPVSPLQRRQDRDHALLRSLLDKEEEQRTRPVEHLPDSDVKPKLEKSESGRDVSYGPGVCGSIKIEKPDMQVKVESGEQHTPDRFENLNEGLGRESTAENSKALLQDLLQTPSSMPSLQASSNFRTASSHVVAAMGRANSQLMSRPPFPNGPGQSRPLLSYSTSLSHVQGGPTHSATAPTHHGECSL
uniref:Nuclear receptor coactivator 1 n=2 Tax=Eptatretus burgeri TaxID=7764 RepID=A0A8C4WVX7_EPTBU